MRADRRRELRDAVLDAEIAVDLLPFKCGQRAVVEDVLRGFAIPCAGAGVADQFVVRGQREADRIGRRVRDVEAVDMRAPIVGRAVRGENVIPAHFDARAADGRADDIWGLRFDHASRSHVVGEAGRRAEVVVVDLVAVHVVTVAIAAEVVRIVVGVAVALGRFRDREDFASGKCRNEGAAAEADGVVAVEEDGRIEVRPGDRWGSLPTFRRCGRCLTCPATAGRDEVVRRVEARGRRPPSTTGPGRS